MSWRMRLIAVLVVASLGFANPASAQGPRWGDITGPVTATSLGIAIPTTLEQVARLTPQDLQRINAAALARLPQVQRLISQGVLVPERKIGLARPAPASSGSSGTSGGRLASPLRSHFFQDARCSIDWQGFIGSGTYVWGWGRTVANTYSRVHAIGSLYQNGNWKGSWGAELDGTVAEGRTDSFWVAWWDHPNFVNNSDHWIKYVGTNTYDWGPWYCSVSHTV